MGFGFWCCAGAGAGGEEAVVAAAGGGSDGFFAGAVGGGGRGDFGEGKGGDDCWLSEEKGISDQVSVRSGVRDGPGRRRNLLDDGEETIAVVRARRWSGWR